MRASKNILIIIAISTALAVALSVASRNFAAPVAADAPAPEVSSAPAAPSEASDDGAVVLVVGDSLSAGYGLADVDSGWVALLQQRLQSEGYDFRVVNASISGDTTRGGRARLPAAIERFAPALTVIELGGNDGLRGFPLEEMEANLADMIERAQTAGSAVVMLGMMIPTNYGERYTDDFQARFATLATRYDIPLVPFFLEDVALDAALMQADGIHPNEAAQPKMLDAVWPALEPVIQTLSVTTD